MSDLDLLLKIRGDSKEAQTALSEVKGLLGETFESPQAVLHALGERIMGSLVSPLGLAAAGGALAIGTFAGVGKVLYEMAEKAAAVGAELDDVSEITGIAVEPLSALRGVAQQTGTDFQSLTSAIVKMRKNVGDGNSDLEKSLKGLGVSVTAFRDMKPEDQLLAISKGFRALPEDANKASLAIGIFGKSGAEMLPLLNKPMEELMQRSRDLGLTWSTEDAAAAEKFEESNKSLHLALEGVETKIGKALIPILANMMESILGNKSTMEGLSAAGGIVAAVLGVVVQVAGYLTTAFFGVLAGGAKVSGWLIELKLLFLETFQTVLDKLSAIPGVAKIIPGLTAMQAGLTDEVARSKVEWGESQKAADKFVQAGGAVYDVSQQIAGALKSVGDGQKAATTGAEAHVAATAHLTAGQKAAQVATDALSEAHKKLDPAVAKATQQMLAAGFGADEIIKRFKDAGVITDEDTAAIKRMDDAHKEAAKKAKEQADAVANLNKSISALTVDQYEAVRMLLERGAAEGDIAKALGITNEQVKRVGESEKARLEIWREQHELAPDFYQNQLAFAEKNTKGIVDNLAIQVQAQAEASDAIEKRTLTSYEYQKTQVKKWADDAKAKVDGTKGNAAAAYAAIDADAEEKLADINKAWLDHGAKTKDELLAAAADAKARFEAIRDDGSYAAADIRKAWQEMVDANDAADDGFASSFHKSIQGLPALVMSSLTGGGGLAGALKGFASSTASDFFGSMFDPSKGGAFGAIANIVPGIGPALGAMVGPLIGKLAGLFKKPEYKKVMSDVGKEYGVALSEALAKEIADIEKKFNVSRTIAEAISLDKIIGESGGITSANLTKWEQQAMPLFDIVKKGGEAGAAATQTLTTLLGQFADQTEKNGGVWDSTFKQMIARAQELGVATSEISGLVEGQQTKIATATTNVVKGLTDTADAAFAAMTEVALKGVKDGNDADAQRTAIVATANATIRANYQDEFDRISRITLNSFNTIVASGKSSAEAIALVGPSIDALIASADKFGLSGNAAFDELARWRQLTVHNKPLLDQVGGLNDLLVATANLGGLTEDSFRDLQAQGVNAFTQLTTAGFTQQETEQAMKPMLESLIRLHKERGYAIDDETQKIIDQAREDGVLGDQAMSTNDILMAGFAAMIKAVGGDLPEAFQKFGKQASTTFGDLPKQAVVAATGINAALASIKDRDVTVHYHGDGAPGGGADTEEVPAFPNRPMEMVTKAGLAMVHPGDVVGVPTPTTMERIRGLAGDGAFAVGGGPTIQVTVAPRMAVFRDRMAMRELADDIKDGITDKLVGSRLVLPRT